MSLPVKKVYIDSRFRTPDSLSTSNFKFQLARNLYMPKNTVFYIEDVCIPNTWLSIETDVNDSLYIRMGGSGRILKLPSGQYTATTLATAIQNQIIADGNLPGLTVSANTVYNTITISTSGFDFRIPTDLELADYDDFSYPASAYDSSNPRSCNNVLGNTTRASSWYSSSRAYTSGFLQLTHNNIYLSSPNLGTYTTLGARGESSILTKIPVTSSYGYLIVDQSTSTHDYLDCSDQTLSTLEFNIRDVEGNIINLHGYNVSFSIVFASHNEDGLR